MDSTVQVLQPNGVLDGTQTEQLKDQVNQMVGSGAKLLLLDLQEVTFMDSSGLAALVVAVKAVRSAGGNLCVCSVNEQVRLLFELTSMDRVFEIFSDRTAFEQKFST
jgi:anti-sigma B factor antagonist